MHSLPDQKALQKQVKFLEQKSKINELSFEDVNKLEHQIINRIIQEMDKFNPTILKFDKPNANIFTKIDSNFLPLLVSLRKLHMSLSDKFFAKRKVWFHSITQDVDIFSTNFKGKKKDYLETKFYEFVEKLDLSKVKEDKPYILSQLFKVFSRPKGQRLIVKLNQLLGNRKVIYENTSDENCSISSNKPGVVCAKNEGGEIDKKYKKIIKNENPVLSDLNFIFRYVKNMYKRNVIFFISSNGKFTIEVPFVTVAHELIHILHALRGSQRRCLKFHKDHRAIIAKLYTNPEEYQAIANGNLSENVIRKEHGIPPRMAHQRAVYDTKIHYYPGWDGGMTSPEVRNTMIYTLFLYCLSHGKTDFSNWQFYNVDFHDLELDGLDFSNAIFEYATFSYVSFKNVKLKKANFKHAKFDCNVKIYDNCDKQGVISFPEKVFYEYVKVKDIMEINSSKNAQCFFKTKSKKGKKKNTVRNQEDGFPDFSISGKKSKRGDSENRRQYENKGMERKESLNRKRKFE